MMSCILQNTALGRACNLICLPLPTRYTSRGKYSEILTVNKLPGVKSDNRRSQYQCVLRLEMKPNYQTDITWHIVFCLTLQG
jgi:hypothetical protein